MRIQNTNTDFQAWLNEIHEDAAVCWDRDVPPEIVMSPFFEYEIAWEYVGYRKEPTVWVEGTEEHGRWWEFCLLAPDGTNCPRWRSDKMAFAEYRAARERSRGTIEQW